jgi:hypothetical protein
MGDYANKILGILRFAANGMAELQLGRYSRRDKVLTYMVKYRQRMLQLDRKELV